jgi:hypothetical protein
MSRQTVEPTAAFAQGFSSIVGNVERVGPVGYIEGA